jgi:hypothetical protein
MSNADKRSVHTDALATLGTIIGPEEGRDAIHIAVLPVEAGEKLHPSQDVGLGSDGKAYSGFRGPVKAVGIVDAFLKTPVQPGQHFWLMLYPRTITSLRHVWVHPDVPDVPLSTYVSEDAAEAGFVSPDINKMTSRAWIQNWISGFERSNYNDEREPFTVDDAIAAARRYIHGGQYWVDGGTFEGEYVPDEFWVHYQIVTGEVVPKQDQESFFSCSC